MIQEKKIKFIDLFAGIGGFRVALNNLGAKCVFSSEIDKYACQTYYENFGEFPYGDITKINTSKIPDHDVLCAGFPCQPFSIAGKRLGFADTRGTLFFDVLRILLDKKPKAFILENVAGIKSHDNGKTMNVIINLLEQAGYNINFKIINSKDVGIPQNRNRWYCVGILQNLGKIHDFKFPEKRKLELNIAKIIDKNAGEEYNISKTALFNIERFFDNFISKNKNNNNNIVIANEIRKSKCNFRNDGISPCLTAKMGTGGNNVPVIVDKKRKLTEKECLKLMGFPENFKIKKNYNQSYKQIGNSVVVPIIQEIAFELIKKIKE